MYLSLFDLAMRDLWDPNQVSQSATLTGTGMCGPEEYWDVMQILLGWEPAVIGTRYRYWQW